MIWLTIFLSIPLIINADVDSDVQDPVNCQAPNHFYVHGACFSIKYQPPIHKSQITRKQAEAVCAKSGKIAFFDNKNQFEMFVTTIREKIFQDDFLVDHLSFWYDLKNIDGKWKWGVWNDEFEIYEQNEFGYIYGRVYPQCIAYKTASLNVYKYIETQIMTISENSTTHGVICRVKSSSPSNLSEKDPHIIQKLYNSKERFCYDLFGKAGNIFVLINDRNTQAGVLAELKDDYYFHKVTLIGGKDRIEITADYGVVNQERFSWSTPTGTKLFKKGIAVAKKDNMFYILLGTKKMYGIKIVRKQKDWSYYLDILFDKRKSLQDVDNNSGGLFGWVQSGEYEFNYPVQLVKEDQKLRGAVQVRGELFKAFYKTGLDGKPCWSLPINDLLYPKTSDDFRL